jgi:hypothetical protein
MAPASPPPSRKRSQPQEREETIQQHAAPCLGVAPVKRRRSSASNADEEPTAGEHAVEEQEPALEEKQHLDGAPQTELFHVTVKTRDELRPSADADAEAKKLDQLLQLKQQMQDKGQEQDKEQDDVAWGHKFAALDSLRRFALHHQDQALRLL